jgi:hypothetical protein
MVQIFNKLSKAVFDTDLKNAKEMIDKYNYIIPHGNMTAEEKKKIDAAKLSNVEKKILPNAGGGEEKNDDAAEALKLEAKELGIEFAPNIGYNTLLKRIKEVKKANETAPNPGEPGETAEI